MTQLVEEHVKGVTVLRISGSLTLSGLAAVEPRFDAMAHGDATRIVVDLQGVHAVSTPAITLMLRTARAVEARGGMVVFAGASPAIRAIFTTCRLDLVMNLVSDVAAAMAAVRAFTPSQAETTGPARR